MEYVHGKQAMKKPRQPAPPGMPKGAGLDETQLRIAFGDEHPDFPRDDWRYEVGNNDTVLGYWEWVEHQVESAADDAEYEAAAASEHATRHPPSITASPAATVAPPRTRRQSR